MQEEEEFIEEITKPIEEIDETFNDKNTHEKKVHKSSKTIEPKVKNLYIQLGKILRSFQGGKLPAAVNALATQKNITYWLDLLYLTQPFKWTINALTSVTLTFQHYASVKRNTIYNEQILLEYVLDRLESPRPIPKTIMEPITIAARTPQSFLVGFLIPLSTETICPSKTAKFISTLIAQIKLPNTYANVFIDHLCKSDRSQVITLFLSRLISRSYALTISSIDAIYAYFLSYQGDSEQMPMIWHNAILEFVQKYGKNLLDEQKEGLTELVKTKSNPKITPQIIELLSQQTNE
ncbi:Bystin-domain-containing protein [Histomonas meleagridis]|uniref:Bystin-domain-containing protein n=1 Tax=Histomonas meleagridis TaxID=135588 RepID=UPI0035597974|nr:Bystin-domain-containing protein [Histomonas meleagridis]KAH0802983.1 Bystin-domain-containing protein [Histomonas meleagridis]